MNKIRLILVIFLLFPLGVCLGRGIEPIAIQELLKTSTSWDGTPLPDYSQGKPEITIVRLTIQPGAEFPVHKHPMINAGIMMSGELTVTTAEKKTIHLKAGDAIAEVVNQWHFGRNDGKVPVEILVFYAGTVGIPITIKK